MTLIIGAIAAVGTIVLLGADSEKISKKTAADQPAKQKQPPHVRIIPATKSNIAEVLELKVRHCQENSLTRPGLHTRRPGLR